MADLVFDDPCVVFALRRESRWFLREFKPQQYFDGAPCAARFCGPEWLSVLVLHTGVGTERAGQAADWLLGEPCLGKVPYRPKVVLAAGFAGALDERLMAGDLVLASEIVDEEGASLPTTWPGTVSVETWQPPMQRGRILTARRIVGRPEEKRMLGERHGASVVDMESAVMARRCRDKGIPFGCVRAVSDTLSEPLSPRLADIVGRGRVSALRLLGASLREPGIIGNLWRLARQTHLASRQLGRALGELLTLTLSWGKDL